MSEAHPLAGLDVTFERLVSEIAEGIAVTDPRLPDNPLVYVNPAFCRLTGFSFEEALGRNCRFLQGADTDQQELGRLRAALKAEQPCVLELLNYRKDGSRFWNNLSISPVFDAAGRLIYFIGVQMDVTRRRELEEKQREFVGNMAHELKTPLAALIGLTETLERQDHLPEAIRQDIYTSLKSQAVRLAATVEEILDLSRIDSGPERLALAQVDLREPLEDALDGLRALAQQNGVAIELSLPDHAVELRGDSWALAMLAGNLLSNAVKFSPPGTVVRVAVYVDGLSAVLSVKDEGPGIAAEHQARIFERFYRVDKSRHREFGGTGLGLAIVKEVAQRHGGYVYLTSETGQGSEFRVVLPLYTIS